MNLGQMLIVILSVVLFSTLIISVYNNMTNQMQMATNTTYLNQSVLVADAAFQKITAEYFAKMMTFTQIHSTFVGNVGFTIPYQLINNQNAVVVQGVSYTPHIRAVYWTQLQNGQATTNVSNCIRLSCRVLVRATADPAEDFWLGDDSDDFNHIITTI